MLNEPESLESGIRHSVDTIDHEKVKHLYAQDKTAEKSSARKMKTNTGTIQNINLVVQTPRKPESKQKKSKSKKGDGKGDFEQLHQIYFDFKGFTDGAITNLNGRKGMFKFQQE